MFVIRKIENKYHVGAYHPFSNGTYIEYDWDPVGETAEVSDAMRVVSFLNGGAPITDWPAGFTFF